MTFRGEVIDANRSQPSLAPATAAESLQQLQKSLALCTAGKKSHSTLEKEILQMELQL